MSFTIEPSTVYETLKSGGKDEILEMLQHNVDQKYTNSDGDTLLHAILRNKIMMETEIIEVLYLFLYHQRANPNVENKRKMTVLHLAVARRMKNVFNILLRFNADMHIVDDNSNTLAHFFIKDELEKIKRISNDPVRNTAENRNEMTNESLKFLEFLMSKKIDFDRKNNQGRSALHLAIAYSLQHFVPHLLKDTKDVESADTDDKTLFEHLLDSRTLARRSQSLGDNSHFECDASYVARSLEILLERGVPLAKCDESGRLIFVKVFEKKQEMDIIEVLINHYLINCADSNFSTALFHELMNSCTWWDNSDTEYFLTVLSDLLSKVAAVNDENQSRKRPAQVAVEANNFRLLKFLKEGGAHLNFRTTQGQSLLHLLAEQKFSIRDFKTEARYLIDHGGCEVNATCEHGKSPLQAALACGNTSMALALVDLGAEINFKDDDSQTPLLQAFAIDKSGELIELLVRSGADVNVANTEGDTPLHLAVSDANLPIVRLLVEHGASVNSANRRMETPLHRAATNESLEIVELLVANGADVNAKDREGNTPLLVHCAASYVSTSIVELLMEYGASVECKNMHLESALHRVAKHDGPVGQVVDLLLAARRVSANARDRQGNTPLLNHCATSTVSLSIVQSLVNHRASVKCKNAREETPLHHVVKKKGDAEEVARLLLKNGAEVNARDRRGNTPLLNHFAVADLDLPIVRTLIWHHADVKVRSRFFMETPLHRAVMSSEAAIVELLLDARADVNARDYKGNTAAHYVFDRLTSQSGRILELFLMRGHHTVKRKASTMAKEVMKYITDLNEPYVRYLVSRIVADGNSLPLDILFLEHGLKIRAANLPFAEECNEVYIKVRHLRRHRSLYYDMCLEEIERLKNTRITSSGTSLYEFLRARPADACLYVKNELLRLLIESENVFTEFPKYADMLRANYREALARESLMESAKEAWYALARVQLPDSLDHIFSYLTDVDLVNVIEASELNDIVSAMRAMAV